jgi:hypothetical protein
VSATTLVCPSCGGREVRRRQDHFACAFCGSRVVPRLEPGTVCAEEVASGLCSKPAESLCRRCARPLCDRHNDPKRFYWHAELDWRHLCPGWRPEDAAAWARVTAPFQRFPASGVPPPFEWVEHERGARRALGVLEDEILAALRGPSAAAGGDAGETACVFDSVCGGCERQAETELRGVVAGFATRYARLAYRERATALRAEWRQALRYMEAVLGRALAKRLRDAESLPALGPLAADSPRRDWDRWGLLLRERLDALEALDGRLAACGGGPAEQPAESP